MSTPNEVEQSTIKLVQAFLRTVRYGSIEIVIHDGRVVQIERREKFRPASETLQKEENSNAS